MKPKTLIIDEIKIIKAMKKRIKKVFIRKNDVKTIVSYNYSEEEVGGFFSRKKIIKHYPRFIIFCSIEKSRPYTRWFKTNEEMEIELKKLLDKLNDKTSDFFSIETEDL